METLPLELRKLGLTEKEAKVYLAGLELGPDSVQNIAKKAGLTRPTAYEIIRSLEEKGLFIESKENKKRRFSAQSPERILGLLRTQKREIEEREREFVRIIASLEARYSKEKERIKIYKGKEGLKVLEEIFSFSTTPEILIINPAGFRMRTALDKIKKRLGKVNLKEIDAKIKGTLIVFDKLIFLPSQKEEGYLID